MGFGFGELVLIVLILLVMGYGLIVPLVGIWMARRRSNQGRRFTVGVVWASINIALYAVGGVYAVSTGAAPIGPIVGIALNCVWLKVSLTANRAAEKQVPIRGGSANAG